MVPDQTNMNMTLQQFPHKAVQCYGEAEFSRLDRKLAMFRALSAEDRDLLPEFEPRISSIAECIEANANLLKLMADSAESIHTPNADKVVTANGTHGDQDEDEKEFLSREVRRGFRLLTKEWSVFGADERGIMYTPLVSAVEDAYEEALRAMQSLTRDKFRVLVPGASAGRLAWELVRKGFAVEGCEESFTALLVGNFALNSTAKKGGIVFYPFVHEHSNVRKGDILMRGVEIPDVDPKDIPSASEFTMRAGEFVEAYEGQDRTWDAVCCCLAFDLGESVLEYVRRVAQVLKAGGVWTFIGPMPCLDGGGGDSIQLSVEEFMGIVRKSGFKIVKKEEVVVLHSSDPQAMRAIRLKVPFVVAVKIRPTT